LSHAYNIHLARVPASGNRKRDSCRHYDEIIEKSENRDKVWDMIDGAQGISPRHQDHGLRILWDPRVPACKLEDIDLVLEFLAWDLSESSENMEIPDL
jgi:hypothetical protein